jgi:DNA invertase Pin-like site-specific DNA recombinase
MGHKLGIPPEYIADLRNIQFLSITENISKGNKCTFIPIYIQKYLLGIASNEIIMNAREKQMEGIKRAKELGRYTGRKVGSKETPELFFEKERTKRIVELKKLGVGNTEVSEKLLVSYGTVHKVVKMMEKFPHLVK